MKIRFTEFQSRFKLILFGYLPFRWDITRRDQLGSLIEGEAAATYSAFPEHLLACCSRVVAFAGGSDLIFVGRSPESVFDHLSGLLFDTSWFDRLELLHFSMRFREEAKIRRDEEVCRKYGVDPVKNGWTAPPPERKVAEFRPTPELVHGVTVSNPQLAAVLRKSGWFSGKRAVPIPEGQAPVRVYLDPHGFVVGAEDEGES